MDPRRVNAYRLLLEGPNFSEEITIDAATIIEATQVADEYLALLKALNDPAEGQHSDPATNTATPSQFQLRIEPAVACPCPISGCSGLARSSSTSSGLFRVVSESPCCFSVARTPSNTSRQVDQSSSLGT